MNERSLLTLSVVALVLLPFALGVAFLFHGDIARVVDVLHRR